MVSAFTTPAHVVSYGDYELSLSVWFLHLFDYCFLPIQVTVRGNIQLDTLLFSRSLTKWDHSEPSPEAKDKYRIRISSQCVVKSGSCLPFNSQVAAKWHNWWSAPLEVTGATCAPSLPFTVCVNTRHLQKSMLLTLLRLNSLFLFRSNVTLFFLSLGIWAHSERPS